MHDEKDAEKTSKRKQFFDFKREQSRKDKMEIYHITSYKIKSMYE
jgi:hypothetical protein